MKAYSLLIALVATGVVGRGAASAGDPLYHAILNGDAAAVSTLLNQGADPNALDSLGKTPLMEAAIHRRTDLGAMLVAKGADVNAANRDGYTALFDAAYASKADFVKLLAGKGADVNRRADMLQRTPLLHAMCLNEKIELETVATLLESGADVNAQDKNGETALLFAARARRPDLMRLLVEKGADVNHYAYDENPLTTTLRIGGEHPDFDTASWLIEKGAAVDARDHDGTTAFMRAAGQCQIETAGFLLGKGADVNARNQRGETVLRRLLTSNDGPQKVPTIKFLLEHGAQINVCPSSHDTLLTTARYWMSGPARAEILGLLRDAETKFAREQESGPPLPPAAEEPFARGLRAAKQQSWSVAIRYFDEARKAAPDYRTPLFNLGLAEAQVPGRELRAVCWLEASLAVAPRIANAAAIRDQITDLEVRAEANRDRILALLKSGAPRIQHSFIEGQPQGMAAASFAIAGDVDTAMTIIDTINDPRARGLTDQERDFQRDDVVRALVKWPSPQAGGVEADHALQAIVRAELFPQRVRDAENVIQRLSYGATSARDSAYTSLAGAQIENGDFNAAESSWSRISNNPNATHSVLCHLIAALESTGHHDDAVAKLASLDALTLQFKKGNDVTTTSYAAVKTHLLVGDVAGAKALLPRIVDQPGFAYHRSAEQEIAARSNNATPAAPRSDAKPSASEMAIGPVEQAEAWVAYLDASLGGPLFTDFSGTVEQLTPANQPTEGNQATAMLRKIADQADALTNNLLTIRALRASEPRDAGSGRPSR